MALTLFEESVKKSPEDAILRYHHGMALLQTGQKEIARDSLRKAVQTGHDFIGRENALQTLKQIS